MQRSDPTKRTPRPRKRGRPLGPNLASGDARDFFARAEELDLRLPEILRQLETARLAAPSYRTLQDWRRGLHAPHFVPFAEWASVLRKLGD